MRAASRSLPQIGAEGLQIRGQLVGHCLLFRNAAATPGHPRVAEQQAMADELTAYLESFGPDLWK